MKQDKLLSYLIKGTMFIAGRNAYGNVVTLETKLPISEEWLRTIEKEVLKTIKRRVTVFWKNIGTKDYCEFVLNFDAKFPYDDYPLQNLLERK